MKIGAVEAILSSVKECLSLYLSASSQWRTGGGCVFNPPPEIPKTLQNRAKLTPIVKTVKNC